MLYYNHFLNSLRCPASPACGNIGAGLLEQQAGQLSPQTYTVFSSDCTEGVLACTMASAREPGRRTMHNERTHECTKARMHTSRASARAYDTAGQGTKEPRNQGTKTSFPQTSQALCHVLGPLTAIITVPGTHGVRVRGSDDVPGPEGLPQDARLNAPFPRHWAAPHRPG